ncbi:sodium-dependent transporter [Actinomyces sp. S4-C9]|uniref:sodium-dependent transporter n=1 Tax=Actinomyces sp. S4-C9 TaxID=1219581 RepID=UPI00050E72B2|nr:sodium-dependent transporter [Actinomyces sp. S4-C9]KGF02203.1 transporter [Actinomyces sp. S4-C9]
MSKNTGPVETNSASRDHWTGQYGFLMAAIGSAIGLGNIWRFPGVAYSNGGGAFILPYLIALLFVGIPVLFLDYSLGHKYRGSAPLTFKRLHSKAESLGWFQVMVSFIITVYYAMIVAWAMMYAIYSVRLAWGEDTTSFFVSDFLQASGDLISFKPVLSILIPLVVLWLFVLFILGRGVSKGVERLNRVFLPLLVVLFLIMVVRALFLPGALEGLNAFFTPDWSALFDANVWLAAVSQIFFSLSIAFGIMLTYASYLPRKANLAGTGLVAGFANSSFEILAGIGVFATLGFMANQQGVGLNELKGITGVGLSFMTFPAIINQMPGGPLFGVLFFISLVLAGITSLLSLLQVVSGAFQDKFGYSARKAAVTVGAVAGVVSVVLFSTTTGLNTLDVVDAFINNVGVVFSAIVMTLLAYFAVPKVRALRKHLNLASAVPVPAAWDWIVGLVTPALLAVMLFQALIGYVTEGYGDWSAGSLNVLIFGWGTIAVAVIGAFILTKLPWREAKHEDVIKFKGEED